MFLLILTIIFCPGGDFEIFLKKMSKSPPYARPRPLGFDIDRCIMSTTFGNNHLEGEYSARVCLRGNQYRKFSAFSGPRTIL